MLVAGGYGATRPGSGFLPQMDDGRIMVKVKLPTGAAVAETDRVLQAIEQEIGDDPLVESLFGVIRIPIWMAILASEYVELDALAV